MGVGAWRQLKGGIKHRWVGVIGLGLNAGVHGLLELMDCVYRAEPGYAGLQVF